ncbi:hypothetical protein GCM10009096_33950 [Parasphingorhabdus litoris]|uniref:Sel1 repeat family protein n=1 Tax=Parasphingorhabdus litoris TaxID=394733 RepID=A0ABN1B1S4_9SPHN|nr:tetratricopeptide repeat protein [Parasphingorhabdus litoris]
MNKQDIETQAAALMRDERYEEAYHLLLPLADQGSAFVLMNLGWICEYGAIGEKDIDGAISYYQCAASGGSSKAHFRLGALLLDEGHLVQARATFEAGAELENLGSMYELGTMLLKGQGGPADEPKGMAWLERAAAAGHFYAQRSLLDIEYRNSKSVLVKMWVMIKIGIMALKFTKEYLKDKSSDRLT